MSSEIEFEPIPGLPGELPPGERILWQGKPEWKALARHTFKVRALAGYFAVFVLLRVVAGFGEDKGTLALQVLITIGLATTCIAVLCLMAWANARSTVYTITTRRIVMRIGVALPMTWNLPFKRLAAADLKERKEGNGDISLQLTAPNKIAWLHLWPHVQPWHFVKARPTLRTIPESTRVAALLSDAIDVWSSAEARG